MIGDSTMCSLLPRFPHQRGLWTCRGCRGLWTAWGRPSAYGPWPVPNQPTAPLDKPPASGLQLAHSHLDNCSGLRPNQLPTCPQPRRRRFPFSFSIAFPPGLLSSHHRAHVSQQSHFLPLDSVTVSSPPRSVRSGPLGRVSKRFAGLSHPHKRQECLFSGRRGR
jgi:hypothetical protein